VRLYLGPPINSGDSDNYGLDDDEGLDIEPEDEDSKGQLRGSAIVDLFIKQPYNMIITPIDEENPLVFTKEELVQFPECDINPPGPGMTAQIILASGDHADAEATGYVKLIRVWTKTDADGKLLELFEGYLSLDVSFDWSLRFKGHGTKEPHGPLPRAA
jgi:hypothetical protein